MKSPTATLTVMALLVVSGMSAGCAVISKPELDKLKSERQLALEQVRKLTERSEGLIAEVIAQRKQIDMLTGLGAERLRKIFHVVRIDLGKYTGGISTDDKPGDDAVKVYLAPIDQDGSTIKAAGEVTVQLYDLQAPPKENLIGQYKWTVDKISKQWHGGFGVYHYSFVCPWKSAPPKHDEITVRIEFADYLTGKHFSAQRLCKVKLPAPAEAPK